MSVWRLAQVTWIRSWILPKQKTDSLFPGSYYEKDGEKGFEPGATFSIIVSGGVHFADYSDDTDTAIVSVYKEQVEVVGFSDDMTYVLWNEVMEYQPVVSVDEASEEETDSETETVSETEAIEEAESETETSQAVADPDGADAEEVEEAAYIPGELLVKNSVPPIRKAI